MYQLVKWIHLVFAFNRLSLQHKWVLTATDDILISPVLEWHEIQEFISSYDFKSCPYNSDHNSNIICGIILLGLGQQL